MEYELSQTELELLEDGETLHISHHILGMEVLSESNRDTCLITKYDFERLKDGETMKWTTGSRDLTLTLTANTDIDLNYAKVGPMAGADANDIEEAIEQGEYLIDEDGFLHAAGYVLGDGLYTM